MVSSGLLRRENLKSYIFTLYAFGRKLSLHSMSCISLLQLHLYMISQILNYQIYMS
jgi:hypothetical protein